MGALDQSRKIGSNITSITGQKRFDDSDFEPTYNIDHTFIDAREGGIKKVGYVPLDNGKPVDKSGVTIGAGIDLGQWDVDSLKEAGATDSFIQKAKPFLGLKGTPASNKLKQQRLVVSDDDEIEKLSNSVREYNLDKYSAYYEKKTGKSFKDLGKEVQTVIGSVVTQYGPNLEERTPNFNKSILNNDVKNMVSELRNFKDKYKTRRNVEADLLDNKTENEDLSGSSLQNKLIEEGYDPGPVDGVIGPKTKDAIKKYQKDNGLVPDGVVGPNTKRSLLSMAGDIFGTPAEASDIPLPKGMEDFEPDIQFDTSDFEPDADFEQEQPTVKEQPRANNAMEIAKGGLRGLQGIAAGTGGLIDMAGQNIQREAEKMLFVNIPGISEEERSKKAESLFKIGKKVSEWGKTAKDFWNRASREGIAKPDEKMFTGSFMQNKSWTRAASIVAEAVPSLGAATAASAAAGGNPIVGLAFLGSIEGEQTFSEARSAGKSVDDANMYFGMAALGTSVLENIPLGRFLKGGEGKLAVDIAKGGLFEGLEEGAQSLWQNMIARIGYDKTRSLTEGMVESVIGGAGSGGVIGGLTSGRAAKLDKEIKQAIDAGVPQVAIDAMQETVANQIVANAEEVERAITEKPKTVEEVSTDVGTKKTIDVNVTPEMEGAKESGLPAIEVKPEIEAALEKSDLSEERRSKIIELLETPEKPKDTGLQSEIVQEQETKPTAPAEAKGEEAPPIISEGEIEYHGTSPENAAKIIKDGKFKVGAGQAGVSTTQGYREALDYAGGNPAGVIAVRVRKGAEMVGTPGKDFLTGTGSFSPNDVTPIEIAKEEKDNVNQDQARLETDKTKAEEVKPLDFKTAEEYVASKINEPIFVHSTDAEAFDKFNTPEVWFEQDSMQGYGERDVGIRYDIKNPFVTTQDPDRQAEYGVSPEEARKNKELYESLGGESNPATFEKLRELGYDTVVDGEGFAALYPEKIQIASQNVPTKNGAMDVEKILTAEWEAAKKEQKKVEVDDVNTIASDFAGRLSQNVGDFHKRFAQAIVDKNPEFISQLVAQAETANRNARAIFVKYTGVELPKTIGGKREAIYKWAGKELPKPKEKAPEPPKMSREEAFKKAQAQRAENALDKSIRYQGTVMKKREMIELLAKRGAVAKMNEKEDDNAMRRLYEERRRLGANGMQNINAKKIEEINKKIDAGVKKVEYTAELPDRSDVVISKTEYDYLNSLNKTKPEAQPEAKKEPWQMSLAEYNEKRKDEDGFYNKSGQQQQYSKKDYSDEYYDLIEKAFIEGKKIPDDVKPSWAITAKEMAMRSDDFLDDTLRASHKSFVERAISEGKPVPSEVLADYPDLKKEPVRDQDIIAGANINYRTDSGKIIGGIVDRVFKGTIYAKADGATTSYPITKEQIIEVIPDRRTGEKQKIKVNPEDFTEDEYVQRIGTSTGLTEEEVRKAYRQFTGKETAKEAGKVQEPVAETEWEATKRKVAEMQAKWEKEKSEKKPEPEQKPKQNKELSVKLRSLADKLEEQIDAKIHSGSSKANPTARRARIASGMYEDGMFLKKIQTIMRTMADEIDAGTLPKELSGINSKAVIEYILRRERMPDRSIHSYTFDSVLKAIDGKSGSVKLKQNLGYVRKNEYSYSLTKEQAEVFKDIVAMAQKYSNDYSIKRALDDIRYFDRINNAGITTQEEYKNVRSMLKEREGGLSESDKRAKRIKDLEAKFIGVKIPGFFPTPRQTAEKIIDLAEIKEGMKVLEPSAGMGGLADIAKERGADVSVYEISPSLQDLLKEKGHNVIGFDFMAEKPEPIYDRIVMNPPFEKMQDVDHVMRAFEFLKPGGRLVSITSESPFFRDDKKAQDFRTFVDENGYSEKLPEGSFKSSFVSTGVNTRVVVLNKEESVIEQPKPAEAMNQPAEDLFPGVKAKEKKLVQKKEYRIINPVGDYEGQYYDTRNLAEKDKQEGDTIIEYIPSPSEKTLEDFIYENRDSGYSEQELRDIHEKAVIDDVMSGKMLDYGDEDYDPILQDYDEIYSDIMEAYTAVERKKLRPIFIKSGADLRLVHRVNSLMANLGKQLNMVGDVSSTGRSILVSGASVKELKSIKGMMAGSLIAYKDGENVRLALPGIGTGSFAASVGTFAEEILQGSTVEPGKKEAEIKPVAVIEMVKLAKMLMDEFPTLKRFPKAWGMFYGQGKGSIKLTPELFKAGKEKQLAATLAHEIGHLVDYMPDSTLKRGNILGRLASLMNYLKTTLPRLSGDDIDSGIITPKERARIARNVEKKIGNRPKEEGALKVWKEERSKAYADAISKEADRRGLVQHKDLRDEMIALSFEWRPIDEGAEQDSAYMDYRSSSKEIYADNMSALLNNPGYVKTKAPLFYELFFEYLDKKPEFKRAYLYMEQIMQGRPADLMEIRLEDRRTMFAKGEQAREMLDEEAKATKRDTWQNIRQLLDDRFFPIARRLNRQKRDAIVPSSEAVHLLREQGMWQVDAYKYVQQIDNDAITPMLKTGATTQDLGDYMYLRRVIGKAEIDKNAEIAKAINTANEEVINALRAQGYEISDNLKDREQLANPLGYTPETAREALDYLKSKMTPEQWSSIVDADKKYREITFKIVQEAADEGVYNKKVFEDIILPNRETYATFGVLDYLTDNVAAGIKASKGTLKEIENPFITTTLKTISLKRLIARNKATKATIEELSSLYPGDIAESKRMFNAAGPTGYMKAPQGKGQVKYLVDGKVVSFDVDPYISKSLENDDTQIIETAAAFNKWSGNSFFRNFVITFNPAFQFFNVQRDFGRSYVNLNAILSEKGKSVSIADVLRAYYKAIPLAVKRNSGVSDKQLDEMMSHKALGIPFNDYNIDARDDGFARILRKYKVVGENMEAKTIREKLVKGWQQVDSAVRFAGNILETLPKVAGYNILKEKGISDREIGFITRTYLGTPDIQTSGKWTKLTNQLFTFSNVTIQGAKADVRLMVNPTTAAGWHLANFKISVMPMLAMAAAILGFAGKDLEDWFEKVPEFDKTNYIIVPLGVDDDGRSTYLRLPHNQTSRITTAILYKILTSGKNKVDGLGGAIDITASQLPSMAPLLTTLGAWGAYMQGQNPQDMFRGRPILSEKAYDAGGIPALSKMVQFSLNNYGLSQFTTYDDRRNTTFETAMQTTPFVSALSRIVKTTDYGLVEKGWAISKEARKETAERSIQRLNLFEERTKGMKSADLSRLLDQNGDIRYNTPLKSDLRKITDKLYDGKADKDDYKTTEKAFIKYALKESGNPWINVFLSTQSLEDKASVLIQAMDSMKQERYNEVFSKLQRAGLITEGLREELRKASMRNKRP